MTTRHHPRDSEWRHYATGRSPISSRRKRTTRSHSGSGRRRGEDCTCQYPTRGLTRRTTTLLLLYATTKEARQLASQSQATLHFGNGRGRILQNGRSFRANDLFRSRNPAGGLLFHERLGGLSYQRWSLSVFQDEVLARCAKVEPGLVRLLGCGRLIAGRGGAHPVVHVSHALPQLGRSVFCGGRPRAAALA